MKKFNENGLTKISVQDLENYYKKIKANSTNWEKKIGKDVNWELSFKELREKDTTKHVHRLHPYKGKFIPQLVEYFLDTHTDKLKKEIYFNKDDTVLDPFRDQAPHSFKLMNWALIV